MFRKQLDVGQLLLQSAHAKCIIACPGISYTALLELLQAGRGYRRQYDALNNLHSNSMHSGCMDANCSASQSQKTTEALDALAVAHVQRRAVCTQASRQPEIPAKQQQLQQAQQFPSSTLAHHTCRDHLTHQHSYQQDQQHHHQHHQQQQHQWQQTAAFTAAAASRIPSPHPQAPTTYQTQQQQQQKKQVHAQQQQEQELQQQQPVSPQQQQQSARILDGRATASTWISELQQQVKMLQPLLGRPPGLAVVLVGNRPDSQLYVNRKAEACAQAGRPSIDVKKLGDVVIRGCTVPVYVSRRAEACACIDLIQLGDVVSK